MAARPSSLKGKQEVQRCVTSPAAWSGRVGLVALLVVLALSLAACWSPDPFREARLNPADQVREALASSDLPILLPTELLEGWRLDSITSDEEGEHTVRHWLTFVSPDGLSLPIMLCVADADAAHRCETEGADRVVNTGQLIGAWHAPEAPDSSMTETLDAWSALPLTPDWEEVGWIDSGS
jgi:hypothetical protein